MFVTVLVRRLESTTVRGIFELTHSFDFSTDETVARGRP
jgi:hypothetical protein